MLISFYDFFHSFGDHLRLKLIFYTRFFVNSLSLKAIKMHRGSNFNIFPNMQIEFENKEIIKK